MPATEDAEQALARADGAYERFDVEALITHLSAAVRDFTAADTPCRAAMACVRLGDVLANALDNQTAGHAWFARAGPTAAVAVLSRDGVWWSASWAGTTARLRDTKGLRYLAELVGAPGGERHALDLVDRSRA